MSDDVQFFAFRLSKGIAKALRIYAATHDTKIQTIGVEALRLWAEQNGVALPPDSTKPEKVGDQAHIN
jgi:hypothetical protein